MKRFFCTFVFLGVLILVSAASMPQKQDEQKSFKGNNLKVLPKNISYEELDSIMDSFKDALGVKCGHCHASQKDNPRKMYFASDAKPEKETARKMMRMTSRINRKYFSPSDGEAMIQVQCQTCHRGNAKPEIKRKASK